MGNDRDIAIVGMSCRFPGAKDLETFWQNLLNGVESITRLSDDQLLAAGVPAAHLARRDYVKAAPVLDDPAVFDAPFFGFSPGEAATLDPQHRVLLELAHGALEDAGCDPRRYPGRIGVVAGSAMNTYFAAAGLAERFVDSYIPTLVASDKDFLATRISYKLGLKGPSLTVQTACSTSLVAVHLACQSLLSEEADLMLAAAVSIRVPHLSGYFNDGGVVSADGHVRAFDAAASGTVFGSGAGVVVLKRAGDALRDGDRIYALVKGTAINNDGDEKAGYTAPSVEGQSEAVVEALANAGLSADDLSYLEAHGSGTPVGDRIELLALTRAFRQFTARSGFCAIGSVKTNVGHLDAAAGMAGLIKTALALQHQRIPATLHFTRANEEIDFATTPFFVAAQARAWPRNSTPRRAGVMATGMGGTNAYAVLEEAPEPPERPAASAGPQLLILSAKSAAAVDAAAADLARALRRASESSLGPPPALADIAATLQFGRRQFAHRRFVVSSGAAEAAAALAVPDAAASGVAADPLPVVFLLPGIGDQYPGMGSGLYQRFAAFRDEADRCAELLRPLIGEDLRQLLFPPDLPGPPPGRPPGIDLKRMLGREGASEPRHPAAERLDQTRFSQPALFVLEYALARLWMHWGVSPARIVGHSMGEYVAACLSGVFTLPEALKLIAVRARLVDALPPGSMVAVMAPEAELRPLLQPETSISLINGPKLCVVAGPSAAMERFQLALKERKLIFRPVRNGHAFHSAMLKPIGEAFLREFSGVTLRAPQIPFISNVTGTWITREQATDPRYWVAHACSTARFSEALAELWGLPPAVLLEVGPGRTLGVLAMQHPARPAGGQPVVLSSLRHDYENASDSAVILQSLGRLWLGGAPVRWEQFGDPARHRKVALPTYPFERARHWLVPDPRGTAAPADPAPGRPPLDDWFYVPAWTQARFPDEPAPAAPSGRTAWLIAGAPSPLAAELERCVQAAGGTVARVALDAPVDRCGQVLADLKRGAPEQLNLLHLGGIAADLTAESVFFSLLRLAQAVGEQPVAARISVVVVTQQVHAVTGAEQLNPAMASAIGLAAVIPRENAAVSSWCVDLPSGSPEQLTGWAPRLLAEFSAPPAAEPGQVIAYRGRARWTRHFIRQPFQAAPGTLRPRGVYLITGGTGGLGLAIARYLAKSCSARLVLTKQHPLPAEGPGPELASALREIEACGGSAEIRVCEASDRAGMQAIVAETVGRYGAIHGAIHTAGRLKDGLIQVKTTASAQAVLQPKIDGAAILHALIEPHRPDFCVLFSSLSSVIPFHGQSDYCAANAFLDAFAFAANARSPVRTVAVDWPVWREVGILTRMETLAGFGGMHEAVLRRAVSVAEGIEIFQRVLGSDFAQVLVSPQPFLAAMADSTDRGLVDLEATTPAEAPSPGPAAPALPAAERPIDDLERSLAQLWAQVLGMPAVGRTQNFLDLGGHSLLAMRIVATIKTDYQIDFSLRRFFDDPTVAGTAAAVRAQVEAEIGNLSDEEINRLSS
jgi:acyl transferase domain-containing protein